jgi:menaquinone-dependent protoporphyrinogen IX oxidase
LKKLNLIQWTSIVEIIGMAAVVVSLAFVGLEIRQNTNQARADTAQTGVDFVKSAYDIVGDEKSAKFILKGFKDFDSLTQTEKMVFDSKMVHVTIEYKVVRELYLQGKLDYEMFYFYEQMMVRLLTTPGVDQWIKAARNTFPDIVL